MKNKSEKLLNSFRVIGRRVHSKEFLKILKEDAVDRVELIKAVTHSTPLLVFWDSSNGEVIDAKEAHHKNPPLGDRSVLSTKGHKGHLRGRSAYFGNVIYIVIYGDQDDYQLSKSQLSLLRRSYPRILSAIREKNSNISQDDIDGAQFINELGNVIEEV